MTGAHSEAVARPSRRLVLGIAAFVLAFGALGYAWLGNFEGWRVGPGSAADVADPAAAAQQIEAMVAKLAARLKSQPDDAQGWSMLGRSYAVLGRYSDAIGAFRKLIELRPNDAQAYADAADALGMAQGQKLEGEPERLIAKALQVDPDNAKALALAGTVAFDKGDYAQAAGQWEHALAKLDPDNPLAPQLRGAAAAARRRAGLPPATVAPGTGGAAASAGAPPAGSGK